MVSSANRIAVERRRIGGIDVLLRRTAGQGPPTLFLHGNPTSSADWVPFLERLRGPAFAFDWPNFGGSERLGPGRFAGDLWSLADFAETAIDELGLGEHNLVVHDWGGIGVAAEQRRPELLRRLVLIDSVVLMGAYRWHFLARVWRRRPAGELFARMTTRAGVALLLRLSRPGLRSMPPEFVDEIWKHWDPAMAAAMLRLYRSADPRALERAGGRLDRLRCPALAVWGTDDPYIGVRDARAYVARFPDAQLVEVERAGHWPWLDRPELVERICGFIER